MSDTSDDIISILHVDDEPEFAELTATFLERENNRFAVETTTSVSAALEWMEERLPDCVVSDYDMPGQNGIEFLETVRQDHPELPFVLYTGNGSEAVASEAVTAGVSDYLQKDTGSEQYKLLAKRIENAVAQFRAQEKLRGRRRQLEQLHGATRDLMAATTRAEIASRAVEIAEETLGFPLSGVHLVDETGERLEPVAVTDGVRDHLDRVPTYEQTTPSRRADEFNWRVFEQGEPAVVEDIHDHDELSASETPTRSGMVYPLGDHGIFITSSPLPNNFDENDVNLVEILATLVTALLDRVQRETELREQKRLLQRKTERLDEFASVVSHDLRNPLTVASGSLEIARTETDAEALDRVDSALDRIDTLLTDLRTLAREGKTVTDREAVDLASLVGNCWQNVETADATLVAEVDRTVQADRSRLKQVFENLYRNGVTHGGSDVTVTIGELEDGFYVADDGPGIPPDERAAVFESGYSTSTEGTGFGLSIVVEIVEAHGWRISATRSTSGGARFEITGVEFADS